MDEAVSIWKQKTYWAVELRIITIRLRQLLHTRFCQSWQNTLKIKIDQKCLVCVRKLLINSEKIVNLPNLRKIELLLLAVFNNSSPLTEYWKLEEKNFPSLKEGKRIWQRKMYRRCFYRDCFSGSLPVLNSIFFS